jgi:hypothetical protein
MGLVAVFDLGLALRRPAMQGFPVYAGLPLAHDLGDR